jgi:hypothetical protein
MTLWVKTLSIKTLNNTNDNSIIPTITTLNITIPSILTLNITIKNGILSKILC